MWPIRPLAVHANMRRKVYENNEGKKMFQDIKNDQLTSLTLKLPDQICNSPYCQPYNSYNVSSVNLVLDQLLIPKLIFFFIFTTYLVDTLLIW